MKAAKWICGYLTMLAVLAFLPLAAQAGGRAAAAPKIQLSFPDSPNIICGVGEVSAIKTFPEEHRDHVKNLFADIYPEIVKVYGEPLTEHADGVTVKVFYV